MRGFFILDDVDGSSDCGVLWASAEEGKARVEPTLLSTREGLLLHLPRGQWLRLAAYDASGRLEKVLQQGYLPAEEYRFGLKSLRTGAHLVRAELGSSSFSRVIGVR